MLKHHFSLTLLIALTLCMSGRSAMLAQKQVYIPDEWRHPWPADSLLYSESDAEGKYTWSKTRSVESENVIVFWDKGYGQTLPSKAPQAYRVDEQDLLNKCEAFYDLEINRLGFVDTTTTNLRKYKVMVLLNHTTDWVCYGGGYDFEVSALWLGPSACKPVGHSVAHEVGHSFHYMCYADASHNNHTSSTSINTGFHLACGNGQAIWEQTAQWQAAQSYPELMYDQSINVFRKSHNYAFSHEWHRYQSYWLLYYLCEHYNDLTTVGQVWRQPMTGQSAGNATDFNQALMKLKGLDATALFALYYDYAARLATWDLEACKPYREPYIGDFDYHCVMLPSTGEGQADSYQVALASTPQSSGFNIIPLKVPAAGQEITCHFTALKAGASLADGDPAEMMGGETQWTASGRTKYLSNTNYANRAFRLGFVALMNDGTRRYLNNDQLYCQGREEVTEDVTMTVPEGTSRLWLIVVPAPTRYVAHRWTEKMTNAEHWPYRFQLEGTEIGARATVYMKPTIDGRSVGNITLNYDVRIPATTNGNYNGTTVAISGQAAAMLCTALQMTPADMADKLQAYSASGPGEGKMMFYPCKPGDGTLVKRASTANGYGHWFNAAGQVCDYPSGYVYSEFNPSALTFNIGPYPDKTRNGQKITISQALYYKKNSHEEATARFVFDISLQAGAPAVELTQTDYSDPTAIRLPLTNSNSHHSHKALYDLTGRPARRSAVWTSSAATAQHSIVIDNNGKKLIK